MASDGAFVQFVVDQMSDAGRIASRKMFGEYAIYCDDKVVALVCDDQLFVKPTPKGRVFMGDVVEAPPYPGAKQYFLVEDRFEDREWLSELIRITAQEVPSSKPKKSKPRRTPAFTFGAERDVKCEALFEKRNRGG
jgi:TfoX/Sxy family transcriptional regulator of competence genes